MQYCSKYCITALRRNRRPRAAAGAYVRHLIAARRAADT